MPHDQRNRNGSWAGNGNAAAFWPGGVGRAVHLEGLLVLGESRERQCAVGPVPSGTDAGAQREEVSSSPKRTFAGDTGRDTLVSWIFRILGK